jgi:predicted phosphodiesterase
MNNKTVALLLLLICSRVIGQTSNDAFVVTPYLQIGTNPTAQSLVLLWQANNATANWSVELQTNGQWVTTAAPTATSIAVANAPAHVVYRAALTGLVSGSTFKYRVLKNGKEVFISQAQAPKAPNQAQRFVVFGDIGAGTKAAKEIANGVYNAKADIILVPGDIVYDNGTIADYKTKFWPIYNAINRDSVGVPLMRSIPFVGAVGNHDADSRDLDKQPDALAYYHYWDQPLNGPISKEGSAITPMLKGSDANKKAFYEGASNRYPTMANFSFNYGNAHWTVLDADTYVDWTDTVLVNWVKHDLANSKEMPWHFVLYHHPGFNSSLEHFEQQQMRLLAPVFEQGKVDVVFNGHVHNYQRSYPMFFKPMRNGVLIVGGKDNKTVRGRVVVGKWTLDKTFDGKTNTHPKGVIYIVTGAGGQDLYDPEQENDSDSWQKFTNKFISTRHTFTVADLKGNKLTIQQLDANGKPVDSFVITK